MAVTKTVYLRFKVKFNINGAKSANEDLKNIMKDIEQGNLTLKVFAKGKNGVTFKQPVNANGEKEYSPKKIVQQAFDFVTNEDITITATLDPNDKVSDYISVRGELWLKHFGQALWFGDIGTFLPNGRSTQTTAAEWGIINVSLAKYETIKVKEDGTPNQLEVRFSRLNPSYVFDIRSFHPQKYFEKWTGFSFDGDNRNFSLKDSFFNKNGEEAQEHQVTSRVWQQVTLGLNKNPVISTSRTESNPSANTVFPIANAGGKENYVKQRFKPRGEAKASVQKAEGLWTMALDTYFWGQNHSFTGSKELTIYDDWRRTDIPSAPTDTIGDSIRKGAEKEIKSRLPPLKSPVPDLDTRMKLWMNIDTQKLVMDVAVLVYGDGFPNTEAFITDSTGNKIFLGTYVRNGGPAIMLPGDNKRIHVGNAFRIKLKPSGSFDEQMWSFAHLIGVEDGELSSVAGVGMAQDPKSPVRLNLNVSVDAVWQQLKGAINDNPTRAMSRTEWNNINLTKKPGLGR